MRKFIPSVLFSVVIALSILGPMLLPGYILTLDMVFGPYFHYNLEWQSGFVNSAPVWFALQWLYTIFPGFVIEKVMLFILFFLLSFISLRYLPLGKVRGHRVAKLFASLVYTLNLFVYERLLAGHWTHLLAYALLPLVIHYMFMFSDRPSKKDALQLGASVALVGVFSLHLFVMSVVMSVLWFAIEIAPAFFKQSIQTIDPKLVSKKTLLISLLTLFLTVLVLTSYWTVPSFLRIERVEASFDVAHWQAFAAATHGKVPLLIDLASMGGYWGEAHAWSQYFAWPQDHVFFWISICGVLLLALIGIVVLWRESRKHALFIVTLSVLALVFSAGVSQTPFAPLNYWLYQHMPFWSGFRDSQKFIALYALCVSIASGRGFIAVLLYIERRTKGFAEVAVPVMLLLPISMGFYMWGGFARQLPNVSYPKSWHIARAQLEANPTAKALVLPWQGYLSLGFNRNLLVANPASQFFGPQAVVSQNVRVGGVYDESSSIEYQKIDKAVRENGTNLSESMHDFLQNRGIQQIIFFQDIRSIDSLDYQFLQSPDFILMTSTPDLEIYILSTTTLH